MDKIFTGNDKARELGFSGLRQMIETLAARSGHKLSGKVSKSTVAARVDFGRWIADCLCGGAAYVEPDDPVFWCSSCGNDQHHGDLLTVMFPANREEIERELLTRPVLPRRDRMPTESVMFGTLLVPGLSRSWHPGESISMLKSQAEEALRRGGRS